MMRQNYEIACLRHMKVFSRPSRKRGYVGWQKAKIDVDSWGEHKQLRFRQRGALQLLTAV